MDQEEVRLEEEHDLPRLHLDLLLHLPDLLLRVNLNSSKKEASFLVLALPSCMGWLLAQDLN